jgi:hypothetical protein
MDCRKIKALFLYISLFLFGSIHANQKPYVINFARDKYHAANKNWSIGEDEKGIMYFGNDIGLLESDGMEWKLYSTPNSVIVRSIAVQSHQTIYTGGSAELGRWDRDQSGRLKYTSFTNLLKDKKELDSQSVWRIWIDKDKVYFQTFSHIYVYDHQNLRKLSAPNGFLLLQKVRNEYWVQEMYGLLYQLKDGILHKVQGSDLLKGKLVRVILPYGRDQYLIGTSTGELYVYDKRQFTLWNPELSSRLSGQELNCGILSSSRNSYYLGTQLNGIYEVDTKGNILNHFSSLNSLQNNTILSLYEDNRNNIWVAMDRGLAYIRYTAGLSYYRTTDSGAGAVYAATLWHGNLLIGTNQGVYYTPQEKINDFDVFSSLKLIEGTQGQVWSFQQIDGRLLCGHTNGLLEILPNLTIKHPYPIDTGVYRIFKTSINGKKLLVLVTYKELHIINEETGRLIPMRQIKDAIYNAEMDHLGNIWLETISRGIYKCRLNDELNSFRYYTYYGHETDKRLPQHLTLQKVGERIVFLGNDHFYVYNEANDNLQLESHLNNCFKDIRNLKRILPINNEENWAITSSSVYRFVYDGYLARIQEAYKVEADNLSLITAYENISVLNDSLSLICLDAGFILHNSQHSKKQITQLTAPYLEFVHTGNDTYADLSKSIRIPYQDNSVTIGFSVSAAFAGNLYVEYMLEDVDGNWSRPEQRNSISYARLPQGIYKLHLRTTDGLGNYSSETILEFEIAAPWYRTYWWFFTCSILIVCVLYITYFLMKRRLQMKHMRQLKAQESAHLKIRNEQLETEIEEKEAELFTQTSFIIHKNELILKLKEIVDEISSRNTQKALQPLYQKINVLLANNLDTEEDWKIFLIKFEQKHRNFFKHLKELYPQLTNNDLRLCACLKLNMETKDIASLMNLSIRAVENNRYRLRKKLNLLPNQDLNEFFIEID